MKKLKLVLPVLMAAIMVLAIPFTFACKKKPQNSGNDVTKLQSIDLDLTYAKTEYYLGENFSAEGLVVRATVLKPKAKEPETVELESNEYVIDWSAYSKSAVAEYPIKVSYTLGEDTLTKSYNVRVKNEILQLDTSSVKKLYVIGEDKTVDKSGLIATLITYEPGKEAASANVTSSVFVDWNKIKLDHEEVYTVPVYYYGAVTVKAEFTVEVIQPRIGLQVSLVDGVVAGATIADDKLSASITLTTDNNSVSIDTSKIEVRKSDKYGVLIDEVITPGPEYSVKVYKEKTEITDLTNLHGGIYQIWVSVQTVDSDGNPYEASGFAPIYVDDIISGITFKSGNTTQQTGKDEISSTWTFTAVYVSGAQEDLTMEQIKAAGGSLTSFDTTVAAQNKSATVVYKHVSASGITTYKNTTVTYTITPLTGEHDYSLTMTFDNASKSAITTWGELTGSSQHCELINGGTTYGSGEKSTADGGISITDYMQIKSGKAVTVSLGSAVKSGSAKITVYVSHNSTGNTRTASLKKSGTEVASEVITSAGSGEPLHVMVADNLDSGIYVLDANDTMYVYKIVVTYTVDYGSGS